MSPHERLVQELDAKFGLRNTKEVWIRRQNSLSADILVGTICRTDLRDISLGTAPWNIFHAHAIQLQTKMLVQVEDVINISNSDPRCSEHPRTLQISLSDGATDFVAVEVELLGSSLSMKTIPGTKIVLLPSVWIRRGRIMLTANDFLFLGAPPTNIWGDSYERRINESLASAGLQNSKVSTFDTLAAAGNGRGNESLHHTRIDMGGIADVILDNENENDDDGFWAEALDMANRTTEFINTGLGQNQQQFEEHPPLDSNNDNNQSANIPPMIYDRQQVEQVSHVVDVINLDNSPEKQQSRRRRKIAEESDNDENNTNVQIPEMPTCDSDIDQTSSLKDDDIVLESESDEDINEDSSIPNLPFLRLENLKSSFPQRCSKSYCRIYSLRWNRKLGISRQQLANTSLMAYLDDGTDTTSISVSTELISQMVNHANESQYFVNGPYENSAQIRYVIRAMCGLVEIKLGDNTNTVSDCIRDHSKMESFTTAFATSVEARLTNHLNDR